MLHLSFSLLLILGFLFVVLILLNKQTFVNLLDTQTFLVEKLSNLKWFQNEWLSGIFIFLVNAILFSLAVLIIFLSSMLNIPYIHIVIMFGATIVSIYFWIAVHRAGNKQRRERLIMGSVGSSFYLFLLLGFIYMIATLEQATPENDPFMAFIGLVFASFVSFVAMITCFRLTGLSRR